MCHHKSPVAEPVVLLSYISLALLRATGVGSTASHLLLIRLRNMAEELTGLPEQDVFLTELLLQEFLRVYRLIKWDCGCEFL